MGAVHLYVAPAATGKTEYVLKHVREATRGLATVAQVVVASGLQIDAWRRRLAGNGGAIGVRVQTFDALYRSILDAAGKAYTDLDDTVQYHLLRSVVKGVEPDHYGSLADRPGFIRLLRQLVGELKAGGIWPEKLAAGVAALGDPPRLSELATIYEEYQARLQAGGWADRAGLGWLAVEALRQRVPDLGRDWPLMVVDGFDNFTPVQLALLEVLVERVGTLMVTMTGDCRTEVPRLAHRRFAETGDRLEATLGVNAEPLPEQHCRHAPDLVQLERGLFSREMVPVDGGDVVELIAAPDRIGEVRAALRWLKARVIEDGFEVGDVALLARDLQPYRESIEQVAIEFELPVRSLDGQSLRRNPAVAALLGLMRILLPRSAGDPEPSLSRRGVVEVWRSPYFDWSASLLSDENEPNGIEPEDADALDAAARWGRVVGGLGQWEGVLNDLTKLTGEEDGDDDERGIPEGLPRGAAAWELQLKFYRFLERVQPPGGMHRVRHWVEWLEALIGEERNDGDEVAGTGRHERGTAARPCPPLGMMAQIEKGPTEWRERDEEALRALKEVLRGLIWAEDALGGPPTDYRTFYRELVGAVEASSYQPMLEVDGRAILVADVLRARGVSWTAVAIVGLAEGEFPRRQREDPLLRDRDRAQLRDLHCLLLEASTASAEAEFFYEAITRGREQLLLTRPRMDDDGVVWQASPFWEEVVRLVEPRPITLPSESIPRPSEVASWPELVESLVGHPSSAAAWAWLATEEVDRHTALEHGAEVFRRRTGERAGSAYDGDLGVLSERLGVEYGPGSAWSASRLESYRSCPFQFLVGSLWELAPREEPTEGLDARQLGNIYHRILEALYKAPEVEDPTDCDQLLAVVRQVADRVLDEAPDKEGFRETAWWQQTRAEIVQNVEQSVARLSELSDEFVPTAYEVPFGFKGGPPLVVCDRGDSFVLRGLIDRVDCTPDGKVRVIDYKTSHPTGYDDRAIRDGKKLQLPLYALAARDALRLGEPVEGFYWHIRHAEASRFTLADFGGGPDEAMEIAVEKAWEAIAGVRRGLFTPSPPDGGCPSYCPAAGFCWHYRPSRGSR